MRLWKGPRAAGGNFSAYTARVMRGGNDLVVRRAHVEADEPARAVRKLVDALGRADWRVLVVFASVRFDADLIAGAIERAFPGVPVIGCTSHGELAAGGDHVGTLAALGIASPRVRVGL